MQKIKTLFMATSMAAVLCGAVALPANALTGTAIYVDSQYVITDTMPLITENTTFVPLRAVSEALGADVDWVGGQAVIEQGGKKIVLTPRQKQAQVNGKTETLVAAPRMENNRVLVPLRFVSEQLGAQVNYADHQIDIATAEGMVPSVGRQYNLCYEDGEYIYLYNDATKMLQIDKKTGEQTLTDLAMYPLILLPEEGVAYYHRSTERADGGYDVTLCSARLDGSNENQLVKNGNNPQVCGEYLYYLVNNTQTVTHDLYRIKLADGVTVGDAELVCPYVNTYFIGGSQVYTKSDNGKLQVMNLDGSGKDVVAKNKGKDAEIDYFCAYDNGWFYATNYQGSRLYRYKSGMRYEVVIDTDIDKTGESLSNVQVVGNKIYCTYRKQAEYIEGRYGTVTTGLYEMDLDGKNVRQLTEDKAIKYYVLSDKIVYQTQVNDAYPQVGGNWFAWRVIDK